MSSAYPLETVGQPGQVAERLLTVRRPVSEDGLALLCTVVREVPGRRPPRARTTAPTAVSRA